MSKERDIYLKKLREISLKRAKDTMSKQTDKSLIDAEKEMVRLEDSVKDPESFEDKDKKATKKFKQDKFKRILDSIRK